MDREQTQKIEEIVNDIIKDEPQLLAHEAHIRRIITTLMRLEPKVVIDEDFKLNLRHRIEGKIARLRAENASRSRTWSDIFQSRFLWLGAAVAATFIFFISVSKQATPTLVSNSDIVNIEDIGSRAFGELPTESANLESVSLKYDERTAAMAPSAASAPSAGAPAGHAPAAASQNIFSAASKVYTGDPVELSKTIMVLRRIKKSSSADSENVVSTIKTPLLNVGSLQNPKVEQVGLSANDLYSIHLNFEEDSAQINTLPVAAGSATVPDCSGENCRIPQAKVMEIANAFLKEHGIDTSAYGSPRAAAPSPDGTVTLVYPLTIEGFAVFNDNGEPFGMTVIVNTVLQRVENVWNISRYHFESATYDGINDWDAVVSKLESKAQTDKVSGLDNAEIVYMRTLQTQANGTSAEIFIPAVAFSKKGQISGAILIPLLPQ